MQKAWYKTGVPTLHGWVFDLRIGELIDLGLDLDIKEGFDPLY